MPKVTANKEKIDIFLSYFQNEYNLINNIEKGKEYKVHKKLLYCSFIDSIAGVVYPKKRNRKRFVDIILEFSEWKHVEYISVPHLVQMLKLTSNSEFLKLKDYIFKIYEQWSDGEIISLKMDVDSNEIYPLWPENDEQFQIKGIRLKALKHVYLLYRYRNSLIHEFLPPGTDIETSEDSVPYYISISELFNDEPISYWNLIYPTSFFKKLCANILINIKPYFENNNIDPLGVIKSGRYWIKGLNQ